MGNSSTKEARSGDNPDGAADGRDRPRDSGRSRNRISRGDLSGFLSLQSSRDRDREVQSPPFERRETRQERDARRLERDRAARAKDRERSTREEHVDGGFLVTLGTYTGMEDFSKPVVRQLQIERKLAPFWRGLNDWSENWAEHQLVAAARGLPIPAADAPPDPELVPQPPPPAEAGPSQSVNKLTVPMGPPTLSTASDRSEAGLGFGLPSPATAGPGKTVSFKPRAKALAAALSVGSRNVSTTDLAPKEMTLPHDPFVNGQPIEVFLYKNATECPICFLSYPPFLNRTRCCDQLICSECFVQIKRADPHLPQHHPDGEARDPNQRLDPEDPPEMLISEPSSCPYCQQPEFGVTYDPPPFRRGLTYSTSSSTFACPTAMSSQSSVNSNPPPTSPQQGARRRTHSLSATAPNVITTDRVRPDWATKLAAARAHQARRAAAATALHTAAFLMGGNEQRSIMRPSRFGRRSAGSNGASTPVPEPGGSAIGGADAPEPGDGGHAGRETEGSRRTRMEELEEMMFMEAVRLSLATEEERKRKEEKTLRKEAKKRQQAERKAQRKHNKDPYDAGGSAASASTISLGPGRGRGNSASSGLRVGATVQGASQAPRGEESLSAEQDNSDATVGGKGKGKGKDKGKGVDRGTPEAAVPASSSAGCSLPMHTANARGGSHLRQMSNASSLASSLADSVQGSCSGQGFINSNVRVAGGRSDDGERETGSEPLFNFRSLAELVGVDIEDGSQQAAGGDDGGRPPGGQEASRRPLSQAREEEKSQAETEHVEESQQPKEARSGNAGTRTATETAQGGGGNKTTTLAASEAANTAETPADEASQGGIRGHEGVAPCPEATLTAETSAAVEKTGGEASVT